MGNKGCYCCGSDDKIKFSASNALKENSRKSTRIAAAERRQQLAPIRKMIAETETEISGFEQLLTKIDATLSQEGYFEREPEKAVELSKKRAELANKLVESEAKWIELSEQLETG